MNLSKNKKSGGSKSYEELPLEISQNAYYQLDENEKNYYNQECFYKKISKGEGNRKKKEANNNTARIGRERQQRAIEIESNPNIEITGYELRELPLNKQQNWKYSRSNGPQWNQTSYYKKKKIENSLNWKAIHQNKIHLYPSDYNKLKPATKALGWVKIYVQTGMQEYSEMYRRRVTQDDELDNILNEIQQKELEMNTLLKKGTKYNTGFYVTQSNLPPNSIQTNKTEYYTLNKPSYNRYMVLSTLLLELNQEKYRIQSILSKL
jgi:hypothetical protein